MLVHTVNTAVSMSVYLINRNNLQLVNLKVNMNDDGKIQVHGNQVKDQT